MSRFRPSFVGSVAVGFLLLACSSSTESNGDVDPSGNDAGTTVDSTDASSSPGTDSGPPPAACGRLTTPCSEGGACEGAADCADKNCRDGKCQATSPADGAKNGDETDIDCGGTQAPACGDGKQCVKNDDCTSSVCSGGVCQAPSPNDHTKNGDETGVDCGGTKAPKCKTGEGCSGDADCDAVRCDTNQKLCAAASDSDGLKNGDETGVDCGGTKTPKKCATGQGCLGDSDCDNVRCDTAATKLCKAPAKDDGLKNGTETDVDCGGNAAPACAVGKACNVHGDCASDGCGYDNKCAVGRSCTAHFGGDTCGSGEVGQAGASHESCCATIAVPGRNLRYGKYEITAGRMRTFIERVGNNVRAYIDSNPTTQIRASDKQFLPTGEHTPKVSFKHCNGNGNDCAVDNNMAFGVNEYLGNTVFLPDRPCPTCGQGCFIGTKDNYAYGHPTYWMPDDAQSYFNAVPRKISKDDLDTKSLNCTPQLLFAAFCKWDGGRLPTQEELSGTASTSAWGSASYPWGASPAYFDTSTTTAPGRIAWPTGSDTFADPNNPAKRITGFFVPAVSWGPQPLDPNNVIYNMTNFNPFITINGRQQMQVIGNLRYVWPMPADTADTDQAYAIAAPGRFIKDKRSISPGGPKDGIFDIAGNLMETTATVKGYDNDSHGPSLPYTGWVGSSFEGHQIQRNGYTVEANILTKYGKMGARCVYDN